MKYAVRTKFVFSGTFYVEAESRAQAKEDVTQHCGLVLGDIHSSLPYEDVDWEFPVHPDKHIGAIRMVYNTQAVTEPALDLMTGGLA